LSFLLVGADRVWGARQTSNSFKADLLGQNRCCRGQDKSDDDPLTLWYSGVMGAKRYNQLWREFKASSAKRCVKAKSVRRNITVVSPKVLFSDGEITYYGHPAYPKLGHLLPAVVFRGCKVNITADN